MKNNFNFILGITSLLSVGIASELQEWTSIICMTLITITSCAIQVYRMIRDKDKDKEGK